MMPGLAALCFSGGQRLLARIASICSRNVLYLAAPVVAAAEPREVDGEDQVAQRRQPGAVVDQAQRAVAR